MSEGSGREGRARRGCPPPARVAVRAARPLAGPSTGPEAPAEALIEVVFGCLRWAGRRVALGPRRITRRMPESAFCDVAPVARRPIDEDPHHDSGRRIDEGLVGPPEPGVQRTGRLAA